jgi:hypothetical protein
LRWIFGDVPVMNDYGLMIFSVLVGFVLKS